VTFVGEAGLDMGGLTKEWFLLLIRQIFHPDYGKMVRTNSASLGWYTADICCKKAVLYYHKTDRFQQIQFLERILNIKMYSYHLNKYVSSLTNFGKVYVGKKFPIVENLYPQIKCFSNGIAIIILTLLIFLSQSLLYLPMLYW